MDNIHRNKMPKATLWCDGACKGNPGPGGWAYLLKRTGKDGLTVETEESGGESSTTNNRMELLAAINGLEALSDRRRVKLICDSEYVVKGISEWLQGWKKKNWRKSDGKPVMNADLWKRMDALLQTHEVEAEWVRGHAGHAENERVDKMASDRAEKHKG